MWAWKEKKSLPKEKTMSLKMCRKCFAFAYDGGWHFERPVNLLENTLDEKVSVQFSQCPACVEEALAMYDMEYV